jgi:hypothetical protein
MTRARGWRDRLGGEGYGGKAAASRRTPKKGGAAFGEVGLGAALAAAACCAMCRAMRYPTFSPAVRCAMRYASFLGVAIRPAAKLFGLPFHGGGVALAELGLVPVGIDFCN